MQHRPAKAQRGPGAEGRNREAGQVRFDALRRYCFETAGDPTGVMLGSGRRRRSTSRYGDAGVVEGGGMCALCKLDGWPVDVGDSGAMSHQDGSSK